MGLGGLGLDSPNIILQTSLQPPVQLTPQVFNPAQQVPPSSPLSAGADPLRHLEEYIEWHVNRAPDGLLFARLLQAEGPYVRIYGLLYDNS